MNDDQLGTAAFVFLDEIKKWKVVKHGWDNVHAVRSDGELVKCKSDSDANDVVKRRASKALITYYHETMANG